MPPTATPARATYRHGDLRNALTEAGVALAREGGPDAVVLREATRRAGVVPNAAYRHFADRAALLAAVRTAAVAAMARAIEGELAALPRRRDRARAARERLRGVGRAYVRFARSEPGLFRVAFAVPERVEEADPALAGAGGLNPFELLAGVLDELVAAGVLARARRPGAEYVAWAAVHGLALLLIDGPLRALPPPQCAAVVERLLDTVEAGLP